MRAERVMWIVAVGVAAVACSGRTEPQRVCEDYARTFADVAATSCRRGSIETNIAAFKASARVGSDCELVQQIRDQAELETACFAWLRNELPRDCGLLDRPDDYVQALPDACKGQLQLDP